MRIVSGKVVGGKVVVDNGSLDEGAVVTVIARDADEAFDLSAEGEATLLVSIAEADRGDVIPAATVLERLRRHE